MSISEIQSKQKEFLNFLIHGDHEMCSTIAKNILSQTNLKELYEDIFKKSLYEVGEMWEFNKISVATEHLSSAIIESILNEFYANIISNDKISKTAIVACVENERHQIGIKMISDIFEMNGWNSHFLGANTTTNELIDFIKSINTDLLAISLTLYFHLPTLENMIQKIRKEFPTLPILVGGQAFLHGGLDVMAKYENVIFQPDLKSTDVFIKTFSQNNFISK